MKLDLSHLMNKLVFDKALEKSHDNEHKLKLEF